ncbi:hypothetical protein DL96DRAFT_1564642 [Flagelloscypha sp. PMI_526]|nr:hypothetical protein DL96DRAFT_1564642 [Flagelloscypha sp. PMI_526]
MPGTEHTTTTTNRNARNSANKKPLAKTNMNLNQTAGSANNKETHQEQPTAPKRPRGRPPKAVASAALADTTNASTAAKIAALEGRSSYRNSQSFVLTKGRTKALLQTSSQESPAWIGPKVSTDNQGGSNTNEDGAANNTNLQGAERNGRVGNERHESQAITTDGANSNRNSRNSIGGTPAAGDRPSGQAPAATQNQRPKKKVLAIPPPKESKFNLQEEMMLAGPKGSQNDEDYNAILRDMRELIVQANLDWTCPWQKISDTDKEGLYQVARSSIPYMAQFIDDWATEEMVKRIIKKKRSYAYKKGDLKVSAKYAYLKVNASKRSETGMRGRAAREMSEEDAAEKKKAIRKRAKEMSQAVSRRTAVAIQVQDDDNNDVE